MPPPNPVMPRTSLALLIWKGCWCLSAYLCQKWCTWFYQQEYGIKTSKTSLLHKSSEKVGPKKMLESTFSELWKLAKGLQQSNFFFFFLRKMMKLSKNSELWGILTCSNPRPPLFRYKLHENNPLSQCCLATTRDCRLELNVFQSLVPKELSSSDLSDNNLLEDPTSKDVCIWSDWELKCKIHSPGGICQKQL